MVSTDGRTDGRTDTEGYNIIPRHTLVAGYNQGERESLLFLLGFIESRNTMFGSVKLLPMTEDPLYMVIEIY